MGHRLVFLAGLLALATTAACDNNKAKPEPPTSKSQTANTKPSATPSVSSGTATAPSAAPSVEVGASGKMAHCPSSVTGASTDVKDVPNGVELTVTASGDAATADIRARTQALLESAKAHSGDKHTGNGGGGGTSGRARCPVVLKDTSLLAADVPGGTKITVTTPNPKELDWLRRETRDRLAEVKEGAEGAGAHRMMHCPSAVEGATTKVTNIKEGVVLAVTAKDPKNRRRDPGAGEARAQRLRARRRRRRAHRRGHPPRRDRKMPDRVHRHHPRGQRPARRDPDHREGEEPRGGGQHSGHDEEAHRANPRTRRVGRAFGVRRTQRFDEALTRRIYMSAGTGCVYVKERFVSWE